MPFRKISTPSFILSAVCVATAGRGETAQAAVTVPATASVVLAGAAPGTRIIRGYSDRDAAPANSPIEVRNITLTTGAVLTFAVTGTTGNGDWPSDLPKRTDIPAEGYVELDRRGISSTYLVDAYAYGIGQISAPLNALVGVFLSDAPPVSGTIGQVDYAYVATRDAVQTPPLRIPFYIGGGVTASGEPRKIIVPPGATRLFLGILTQENASSTGALRVTYTLSPSPASAVGTAHAVNMSTRVYVGIGESVTVAGIAVKGSGTRSYLVRAVGPGLSQFGVNGALAEPVLSLYNAAGLRVLEARRWDDSLSSTFAAVGAFALRSDSADAALVVRLAEGNYTIVVSGDTFGGVGRPRIPLQGVALVELYELQ